MAEKNPLTEKLRPHVQDIKDAAEKGDSTAQRIINLYRLHQDCPSDPGAPALCEQVFDDWMKDRR